VKEFHLLSKAYEVLVDPKAKEAYDSVIRAKVLQKKKYEQLDEKRRKLRDGKQVLHTVRSSPKE
jgi:DnaJ-class molecular chaperone